MEDRALRLGPSPALPQQAEDWPALKSLRRQRLPLVMLLPVGQSLGSGLPVLEAAGPLEARQGRGLALLLHLAGLPAQIKLRRLSLNIVRPMHVASPA